MIQSPDAAPFSVISLLASVSTILRGNPSLIKDLHSQQGDGAALTALAGRGEIQPPQETGCHVRSSMAVEQTVSP